MAQPPGGTYRTIRAAVLDTQTYAPGVPIYRNGRLLNAADILAR